MRQKRNAPVDSMGVHKVGDIQEKPENYRYHILVGALLSSQTRDTVEIFYSLIDNLFCCRKFKKTRINTTENIRDSY